MKRFLFLAIVVLGISGQARSQNFVMAYLDGWGVNSNIMWDTTAFNWQGLTHVIIFKIDPRTYPPYYAWDGWDAPIGSQRTVIRQAHRANVKVLLDIGGVGGEWYAVTRDSATCQTVVDAIANYAWDIGYDGLDLDWETNIDHNGFHMLSRILRRKLDSWPTRGILTAAIGRQSWGTAYIPILNSYYDYLNIMTYDCNGWWSTKSAFHEPVYDASSNYAGGLGYEHPLMIINRAAESWISDGLQRSKTSLGFSTYGRCWSLSKGITRPGQTPNNSGWEGIDTYYNILKNVQSGAGVVHRDTTAMMAWFENTTGNSNYYGYINFNDEWAMRKKIAYLRSKGWGGLMIFTIDQARMGEANALPTPNSWPLFDVIRSELMPPSPSAPAFYSHPANRSVLLGSAVTFTALANGYPFPAYQWQRSNNGGSTWLDISGATSQTYSNGPTTQTDNGAMFRCIATNSSGSAVSNEAMLIVRLPILANPRSDDFSSGALSPLVWRVYQSSLITTSGRGTNNAMVNFSLNGTRRDMWTDNKLAPRILQDIADGNFEVVAKFESVPTQAYSTEGILVKESAEKFLRFDVLFQPAGLRFWSGLIDGGSFVQHINQSITVPNGNVWIKVGRTDNTWTASLSTDGVAYSIVGTFSQEFVSDSIGVFAANSSTGGTAPSFQARCDYFFNASSPISPEDPDDLPYATFSANQDTLPMGGGSVTLDWSASNAVTAVIDNNIGPVSLTGSTTVTIGQTKTFTLTLTNASGTRSYTVIVVVPLPGVGDPNDVSSQGTPIAFITSPTGGGSRSLETIRDGLAPMVGSTNAAEQYDTYDGNTSRAYDWMGYTFPSTYSFRTITYQEGIHSSEGGYFSGSPRVEVRTAGQWIEVQGLAITPAYQGVNAPNFVTYTLQFNSTLGDAIRIVGVPGGSARYISAAEIRISGAPTNDVPPSEKPQLYDLTANYPNPFNPTTSFNVLIAKSSQVRVAIYNLLGQRVRTLVDGTLGQGTWRVVWDGKDESGMQQSSGVYIYRMETSEYVVSRKMILAK